MCSYFLTNIHANTSMMSCVLFGVFTFLWLMYAITALMHWQLNRACLHCSWTSVCGLYSIVVSSVCVCMLWARTAKRWGKKAKVNSLKRKKKAPCDKMAQTFRNWRFLKVEIYWWYWTCTIAEVPLHPVSTAMFPRPKWHHILRIVLFSLINWLGLLQFTFVHAKYCQANLPH